MTPTARTGTEPERTLTPGEVAALFRVDPKTVARWARSGKLDHTFTPGGHRRFKESKVEAFLNGEVGEPVGHRRQAEAA